MQYRKLFIVLAQLIISPVQFGSTPAENLINSLITNLYNMANDILKNDPTSLLAQSYIEQALSYIPLNQDEALTGQITDLAINNYLALANDKFSSLQTASSGYAYLDKIFLLMQNKNVEALYKNLFPDLITSYQNLGIDILKQDPTNLLGFEYFKIGEYCAKIYNLSEEQIQMQTMLATYAKSASEFLFSRERESQEGLFFLSYAINQAKNIAGSEMLVSYSNELINIYKNIASNYLKNAETTELGLAYYNYAAEAARQTGDLNIINEIYGEIITEYETLANANQNSMEAINYLRKAITFAQKLANLENSLK